METQRTYIAIDLKSFYASVECMQRNLDPMTTNLVVADLSRTEKTICLAVSPALKQYGISGRARLFEVVQQVKQANAQRQRKALGRTFTGASHDDTELKAHPELAIDYGAERIVAVSAPTLRISNLKLFYENNRIFPAAKNLLRFITVKLLAFYIILRYDVGERRRLQ